jgi:hypothetical protein
MKRWLVLFTTLSVLLLIVLPACGGDEKTLTPAYTDTSVAPLIATITPVLTPTAIPGVTQTNTPAPTLSGPVKHSCSSVGRAYQGDLPRSS